MNELTIPYESRELIETGRSTIIAHKREAVKRIEDATALLNAGTYKGERLNAFDSEIKTITAATDALVEKVALATHVKELLVELAAAKNEITAAVKVRQEKLRELKAENEPPEMTHTYFYAITATDAEHRSLQKSIAKVGAKFDVVSPQKNAEWRTAAKLFGVKEA